MCIEFNLHRSCACEFGVTLEELRAQIGAITNYMESDALPPVIREKLREMELANEALQEQYNSLQDRLTHAGQEKADLHNALIELRSVQKDS